MDGATSYRVSDPLDPAETPGHPYEGLRGGLRMGRWRQTFTGLEYRGRNALRRRVKLAPPDQPPTGAPREPMFGSSRLRARDLCAPIFFGNEMFSALSGYRYSKWRQRGAPKELSKTLWLGESLPVVSHRGKLDPKRALREQWTPSGWSSVVYLDGRERYYVRSEMREDGDWYSRWVGEKYARALASGLRALSKTAGEEEEVQVVRIDYRKAYRRIYLLRLVESDRYLVVHVRGRERPLNGLLEAEELAERLAGTRRGSSRKVSPRSTTICGVRNRRPRSQPDSAMTVAAGVVAVSARRNLGGASAAGRPGRGRRGGSGRGCVRSPGAGPSR